jgi:hypothetical protein
MDLPSTRGTPGPLRIVRKTVINSEKLNELAVRLGLQVIPEVLGSLVGCIPGSNTL